MRQKKDLKILEILVLAIGPWMADILVSAQKKNILVDLYFLP